MFCSGFINLFFTTFRETGVFHFEEVYFNKYWMKMVVCNTYIRLSQSQATSWSFGWKSEKSSYFKEAFIRIVIWQNFQFCHELVFKCLLHIYEKFQKDLDMLTCLIGDSKLQVIKKNLVRFTTLWPFTPKYALVTLAV